MALAEPLRNIKLVNDSTRSQYGGIDHCWQDHISAAAGRAHQNKQTTFATVWPPSSSNVLTPETTYQFCDTVSALFRSYHSTSRKHIAHKLSEPRTPNLIDSTISLKMPFSIVNKISGWFSHQDKAEEEEAKRAAWREQQAVRLCLPACLPFSSLPSCSTSADFASCCYRMIFSTLL